MGDDRRNDPDDAQHREADNEPTRTIAEHHEAMSALPEFIGDYRVVGKLGEGGMGIVFECEQASPRRKVAVKVVRGGEFVDEGRARLFQREAETLARLEHPNIGSIYESGRTADGQHFFAMELVRGKTLYEFLQLRPPVATDGELRLRLALFRMVADAVHYAHQCGVIHRDLKPSNIIVTDAIDDEAKNGIGGTSRAPQLPQVKILDFGLARITDGDTAAASIVTDIGVIKGTLAYMSPEQARGNPEYIDIRSDVYSLGMILYEMISGKRPYDIGGRSLAEIVRTICEDEPRPLRQALPTPFRLDPDVEQIVGKALAKEPDRRYPSAAELSADVSRYLTFQPIVARPPSSIYQLRKFAKRNKALVGGVVATVLTLAAGVVASTLFGLQATRERNEANAQRREAEWRSYVGNLAAAEASLRIGEMTNAKTRLADCPREFRGWEWSYLTTRADLAEFVLPDHGGIVYQAAFSPDGSLIASASRDGAVRVFDAVSGELVNTWRGHDGPVMSLAFAPDGKFLATGSFDRTIRIWKAPAGELVSTLTGHTDTVDAVAFDPAGKALASGSWDGTVRLWDVGSGSPRRTMTGHKLWVMSVAFSPDGSLLASAGLDKTVQVWNSATGSRVAILSGHQRGVNAVAFHPDGSRLASGSLDKSIHLWSTTSKDPLSVFVGHEDDVRALAFSPDGSQLVSGAIDNTVRLWDTESARPVATLVGHDGGVFSVGFSPDGTRLVSGSADHAVRVWDAASPDWLSKLVGHENQVASVAFSPDGSLLATASWDNTARVWDVETGESIATLIGHAHFVEAVAFNPEGTLLASAGTLGTIRFWDPITGEALAVLGDSRSKVTSVAFSPDGERLAAACGDNRVRVFDVATGALLSASQGHDGPVNSVTFDAAGRLFASASRDGEARVWDATTGEHVATLSGHENPVNDIAFSPDGAHVVTASWDQTLRTWDPVSGGPILTLTGHSANIEEVKFSPDGTRIGSAAWDSTVRVWDADSGEPLVTLNTDGGRLRALAFSPDGRRLASGARDRLVRVWDTAPLDDSPRHLAIARAFEQRGDDHAAEPFRRKIVARYRSENDADAALAAGLMALGASLNRLGKHDEAATVLQEAHDFYRDTFGSMDWRTTRSGSLLGSSWLGLGRVEEGERLVAEAVSVTLSAPEGPLRYRCATLLRYLESQESDGTTQDDLASGIGAENGARLARFILKCTNGPKATAHALELARRAERSGDIGIELLETLVVASLRNNELGAALEYRRNALSALPVGPSWTRSRVENTSASFLKRAKEIVEEGRTLNAEGHFADIERPLREALDVLQEFLPPERWEIAQAKSLLGESIAGQHRYREAEPFLIAGYEAMDPALQGELQRKRVVEFRRAALDRVVALYENWQKPEIAAEWRARTDSRSRGR